MTRWYRVPRPAGLPATEDPDRVIAFLQAAGIPAATVQITADQVAVDAASDPTAALAGYVSQPTPDEKATARLAAYLQIYRDGGTPTPAQVARALKAVIALQLRQMDEAD